ncbi:LCP family protein [Peptoniphilus sp. GNH]|nr:cell envelope-like function transcriptional attenuator common domain protein [Clostridiales bacterium KA00134]UHR02904.1 LCP family protein [Peptoniphilus sp. GNH]
MKGFFKGFFITLLILIVAFVGFSLYSAFTATKSSPLDVIKAFRQEPSDLQFLLLGVDSSDQNKNKSTRSDVMMLISISSENKKASIVSIPRDTRVKIQGKKNYQKINAAYAIGKEQLALKTVNTVFNLNLDKYLVVDYGIVKDVVNKLGGISIDVPVDMKYTDTWDDPPLEIDIKKGYQTLNGEDAIKFLRFRKGEGGSGYKNQDLDRVNSQKMFIDAVLEKVTKPSGILKLPSLLRIYQERINTNITLNEMIGAFKLLKSNDGEKMEGHTLPGSPKYINRVSYFIYDEKESALLLRSLNLK